LINTICFIKMGTIFSGPQISSVSFNDANSLVTNVIQSTTQSCITSNVGGNSIVVDGNYNVLEDITQSLTFTVNQNCSAMVEDPDDFSTSISNAIQQQLSQSSAEVGSFLSGLQDDNAASSITNAVTTNITQETVQNCLSQNSFPNSITIIGNGNDILNVTQSTVADVIMSCSLNQNGAITSSQTIADTLNQSSSQAQTSPFQPLLDSMNKIFAEGIGAVVIMFVVLIVLVILFKAISGIRKSKKSKASDDLNASTETPDNLNASAATTDSNAK